MIRIGTVSIALLGCMAFSASFAMLLPSAAQAECLYLDVSGDWVAQQSNGPHVQFILQQTGSQIQGVGLYGHENRATVDGTVTGLSLKMTAYWDNGSIGEYTGVMKYGEGYSNLPNAGKALTTVGRTGGTTVDKNHPESPATWFTNRQFSCGKYDDATPDYSFGTPPSSAPPSVALGRVNPPPGTARDAGRPICDVAAEARARNSPAAPALEAQCRAAKSAAPVKALGVYEKAGKERNLAYALIPGHIGGASVSQSSRGHVLTVEGSGKCGLKVFEELDGKAVEIYDYKGPLPTTIPMVNTLPGMHVAKIESDKSSEGCDGTASASFPIAKPGRNSRSSAR